MIKLIALDLDGTFLKKDNTIDEDTLKKLKSFKNASYMIATGRCLSFVEGIVEKYELDCDLLLNNGHEFISKDNKTRFAYPFEKNQLKEIVKIFIENKYNFIMYSDDGNKYTFSELEKFYEKHIEGCTLVHGERIHSLMDKPVFSKENFLDRMILLNTIDDLDNINILKIDAMNISSISVKGTVEKLRGFDNLAVSSSHDAFVEVCDTTMNKGLMIEKVAKLKGISLDEVATFGDGSNDIELLSMFKYSFAMGNANDEIKKLGKYTTESNDNQGVLKGLEILEKENILI